MNRETFLTRLNWVRDNLDEMRADCLVVTKPANVAYITGFSGDDSWAVVTPRAVYLVTDSRFTEQAAVECPQCRLVERKGRMVAAVASLLRNRRSIRTIAVECSVSVADFRGLKSRSTGRVKAVGGVIESARRQKNSGELSAIRAASDIAAKALRRTVRRIRPGLAENELAGIVDFQIRKFGGRNCFETIVAFGANASRPHHRPTDTKLAENDTVLIDFGASHNGYCCDVTRCFAVGAPSRFYSRVYAAVQEAQAAALKEVRAGVVIRQVDAAARAVLKQHRLPVYGHGTGHGLGLEVHESPTVSPKSEGTLQAGDVITIEPAVYIPGKLGIRIEDDIVVTEDGFILLSDDCPHRPVIPIV